jgi:hypothetical protein
MLIDTLRHQMIDRLERELAAIRQAEASIDAVDRLACALLGVGCKAAAVGQMTHDGCTAAVVTHEAPDRVDEALALLGVGYETVDAVDIGSYRLRLIRVHVGGQMVMLSVQHKKADVPTDEALEATERMAA